MHVIHAAEPIQSGDLIYEISYVGVEGPPATFLHDLCEETPCPVAAGNFLLLHTELLPPVTPPVSLHHILTLYTIHSAVASVHLHIMALFSTANPN